MASHIHSQSLGDYVAAYADIVRRSFASNIVDTNPATTTQGPITDPEGRLAPTELAPWRDVCDILDELFNCLYDFTDTTADEFPCRLHVDETGHELSIINSEAAVHLFDVDTIYKPAKRIIDSALKRPFLQGAIASLLHRRGYKINAALTADGGPASVGQVVFSPHSRTISVPMQGLHGQKRKRSTSPSLSSEPEAGNSEVGDIDIQAAGTNVEEEDEIEVEIEVAPNEPPPETSPGFPPAEPDKITIKSGPGDYYCSFLPNATLHSSRLLMIGEAKAPHKLTRSLIRSALGDNSITIDTRQFIQQQISQDPIEPRLPEHLFARSTPSGGPTYHNQRWLAAVATQIYSTLLFKQLRYGYVTTGESYILLQIRPGQPAAMDYLLLPAISDPPSQQEGPVWVKWLAATPLARVSCLALLSLFTMHGALTAAEFEQAKANSSMIWRTPRCREQSLESRSFVSTAPSATKDSDSDWAESHNASRHRRGSCMPAATKRPCPDTTWDDSDRHQNPPKRRKLSAPTPTHCQDEEELLRRRLTPPPEKQEHITTVPFCTARCISSLTRSTVTTDTSCPNWTVHQMHKPGPPSSISELLNLARSSISLPKYTKNPEDHPDDEPSILSEPTTNAMYTRHFGATAAIFKVRIEPGGYVLIAKAARPLNTGTVDALKREQKAYQRLRTLQGDAVPVCVGLVDYRAPAAQEAATNPLLGRFSAFLLLSWAGPSLLRPLGTDVQIDLKRIKADTDMHLQRIHKLSVLHGDAALRNIAVTSSGSVLLVDLGLADTKGRFSRRLVRHHPHISKDEIELAFRLACSRERESCLSQLDDWVYRIRGNQKLECC